MFNPEEKQEHDVAAAQQYQVAVAFKKVYAMHACVRVSVFMFAV